MYTILHLETSTFYRNIMADICRDLGIHYLHADGGSQAFQIMEKEPVDLVITAMELMEGTSIDFMKTFNQSRFAHLPVMVITSTDSPQMRRHMFDMGIIDYISKKASVDDIRRMLLTCRGDDDLSRVMTGLSYAVCDDSVLDRGVIGRIFTMNRMTDCTFFRTGDELLGMDRDFDVYLIDIVLETISGRSLIYKLREAGRKGVIIGISGIDNDKTIAGVLAVGADDYIIKPFNQEIFISRIRSAIRTYLLVRELEVKNRQLEKASVTDSLTGLYNHGFIMEQVSKEIQKKKRYGAHVSIIMLDIDHFKLINDSHGHQAGDDVLKLIASTIQGTVREVDMVGRYGGEEFLVVLPNTTLDDARIAAERIRKRVEETNLDRKGFRATISAGVAEHRDEPMEDFVKKADDGLYRAKSGGRNRVCDV